jgi:hypothetical protein
MTPCAPICPTCRVAWWAGVLAARVGCSLVLQQLLQMPRSVGTSVACSCCLLPVVLLDSLTEASLVIDGRASDCWPHMGTRERRLVHLVHWVPLAGNWPSCCQFGCMHRHLLIRYSWCCGSDAQSVGCGCACDMSVLNAALSSAQQLLCRTWVQRSSRLAVCSCPHS